MADLPVNFEERARAAREASGGGYPVQISAGDLMRNFVFSALDADESLIEQTTGQGGHPSRKLKIPAMPSGTEASQLTAKSGMLSWAAGLPDGTASGELLRWDSETAKWVPFGRGTNQNQLLMWGPNGWQAAPAPALTGTHVLGAEGGGPGHAAGGGSVRRGAAGAPRPAHLPPGPPPGEARPQLG